MWLKNKIPEIRNPNSTRPWQHVLEALSGYLDLSLRLDKDRSINGHSFNFSSDKIKNVTVLQFLKKIKVKWPETNWTIRQNNKFYESSLLQLDTSKVKKILKWKARLNIDETIEFVVNWYKNFQKNKKNTLDISRKQIIKFMKKKI
jgi:CDP-glucose 4,6-dehydratase